MKEKTYRRVSFMKLKDTRKSTVIYDYRFEFDAPKFYDFTKKEW